jgi:hypothetical protein
MSGSMGGFTPAQLSAILQMVQAYQQPSAASNPQVPSSQGVAAPNGQPPAQGISPSTIAQSPAAGSAIPGAAQRMMNGGFMPGRGQGASPSMIAQPSVPAAGPLLPGGAPNPANLNIQQLLQMMNGAGGGTSLPTPTSQPPQSYGASGPSQLAPNPYAPQPPWGTPGQSGP